MVCLRINPNPQIAVLSIMPPLTMPSLNHPYQAFHALQTGNSQSMQVYQALDGLSLNNTVVALGMFDGLHQGHQTILRKTVAVAQAIQATPVVLSFANHPQMVLSQTPPTLLSDLSQRLALFERFGLQVAVVPTFTADWKHISAQDFVSQVLLAHLGARAVVSGYDYRFGANRQGDTQMLKDFGQRQGFETQVIEPVQVQGQIVSSTLIRKLLNYGDIATANPLLGYPYALAAHVVPGSNRGQALGFPTANLAPDANRLLPATGTYCGYAVLDDTVYKAVWNIGTNPTFTADSAELPPRRLEVHLLGYAGGDLYGRALRIHFMHRLRDETRFASVDALKAQIQADCDKATLALPTVMDAGDLWP
jgi:riboflavin kinase/FMN adenylyltransferase